MTPPYKFASLTDKSISSAIRVPCLKFKTGPLFSLISLAVLLKRISEPAFVLPKVFGASSSAFTILTSTVESPETLKCSVLRSC